MKHIFEWQEYEHEYTEKSPDWLWNVIIITTGFIVAAILFENYFFALFLGVSAFALVIQALRVPRIINFGINKKGVMIGERFYRYDEIDYFWIDDFSDEAKKDILKLKLNNPLSAIVIIPINQMDTDEIKDFLLQYVDESYIGDNLFGKLLERLGF